jgi:hypothetical protein
MTLMKVLLSGLKVKLRPFCQDLVHFPPHLPAGNVRDLRHFAPINRGEASGPTRPGRDAGTMKVGIRALPE